MEKSDIEEKIHHLRGMVEQIDRGFNYIDKDAINAGIWALEALKYRNEDTVDFQGWPIRNQTWGELTNILQDIKEKTIAECGECDFDDFKVRLLFDDGMGYGAMNGYCNAVEVDVENKDIRFWG